MINISFNIIQGRTFQQMNITAKNVAKNTLNVNATCGWDVTMKGVGGGGTSPVSTCHAFLQEKKCGHAQFASKTNKTIATDTQLH